MSEIKHPIGAWEIVKTSGGHGVYEKGWGFVAIHDKSCHGHWNEGQMARRALIAAAPELLDALQEIINTPWLGGKGGFHKARAAIAKATGEV